MIGKLTEGNITRALIKFSIPMILGNLLQQLYNVADTFIVGHYIGTWCSGSSWLIFYDYDFFNFHYLRFFAWGVEFYFRCFYGAKQIKINWNIIFCSSFVGIGHFSIGLEIVCLLAIDLILNFMNIPRDIFTDTHQYLFIIFLGLVFTFIYNYFPRY